jgi:predicted phosphoribosyltransferase
VPVAAEVARALGARLDIIVVKKLGSPFTPELGMGAVCSDGASVIRHEFIREAGIEQEFVDRELVARSQDAKDVEQRYRGDMPALELRGARVVIVDDGIATGSSIEAAVVSVRRRGAARVTVAAPVSSQHAAQALSGLADEFIVIEAPEMFWAVGQFYEDFSQIEDDEVRKLLAESRDTPAEGKNVS